MNPENHGQEILPSLAVARLTEAQVRFCQLKAAGFDEEGNKLNQTECAIRAGLGNSKASSRTLAARYMKDPRILARIEELKQEAFGDLKLHNNEVIQGLRELAEISLGRKSVKKTVIDQANDEGEVSHTAKTFSVYQPDLGQAHQTLKTMGNITGLISNGSSHKQGSKSSGSGGHSTGAEGRELNGVERTARVFELLKRSGALGAGQDTDCPDGDLGATTRATD